jgi:hypothetical protein
MVCSNARKGRWRYDLKYQVRQRFPFSIPPPPVAAAAAAAASFFHHVACDDVHPNGTLTIYGN